MVASVSWSKLFFAFTMIVFVHNYNVYSDMMCFLKILFDSWQVLCCLELCKPASLLVTSHCDIPVNCCVSSVEGTIVALNVCSIGGWAAPRSNSANFHSCLNVLCEKSLIPFIQVISLELYNIQVNQTTFLMQVCLLGIYWIQPFWGILSKAFRQ